MTAFAAMVDVLFADPNMAADAVFTPAGGGPVGCRVIRARPDEIVSLGGQSARSATHQFDLAVAQVARPREGDALTIGNESFVIRGAPVRDEERLVWRVDCRPA